MSEEVNGVPISGSRTLALIGDMKQMDAKYVRGLDIAGYGTSLAIGVGVPIPILNTDIMQKCAISDEEIYANLIDYSVTSKSRPVLDRYNYAQLRSGTIDYEGRTIRTSALSSYWGARKVAAELKDWIEKGEFILNKPTMILPKEGKVKGLTVKG